MENFTPQELYITAGAVILLLLTLATIMVSAMVKKRKERLNQNKEIEVTPLQPKMFSEEPLSRTITKSYSVPLKREKKGKMKERVFTDLNIKGLGWIIFDLTLDSAYEIDLKDMLIEASPVAQILMEKHPDFLNKIYIVATEDSYLNILLEEQYFGVHVEGTDNNKICLFYPVEKTFVNGLSLNEMQSFGIEMIQVSISTRSVRTSEGPYFGVLTTMNELCPLLGDIFLQDIENVLNGIKTSFCACYTLPSQRRVFARGKILRDILLIIVEPAGNGTLEPPPMPPVK